jgi:hypothetical protein
MSNGILLSFVAVPPMAFFLISSDLLRVSAPPR